MANKISENTELTLDLKTLIIIVSFVITAAGMWFAIQADIQLAKELPEPPVTRTEYDLKDQLIRETIMNTQSKVEENSDKLDKIDEKLYEIIEKKVNHEKHLNFNNNTYNNCMLLSRVHIVRNKLRVELEKFS